MDALLEQARDLYEGQIDFEGQRLAELLMTVLLSLSGVLVFFAGFITQNIYNALYVGLGGTVLTFLVVVPQWPFYNQSPQPWLPAKTGNAMLRNVQIEVDGQKVG